MLSPAEEDTHVVVSLYLPLAAVSLSMLLQESSLPIGRSNVLAELLEREVSTVETFQGSPPLHLPSIRRARSGA